MCGRRNYIRQLKILRAFILYLWLMWIRRRSAIDNIFLLWNRRTHCHNNRHQLVWTESFTRTLLVEIRYSANRTTTFPAIFELMTDINTIDQRRFYLRKKIQHIATHIRIFNEKDVELPEFF